MTVHTAARISYENLAMSELEVGCAERDACDLRTAGDDEREHTNELARLWHVAFGDDAARVHGDGRSQTIRTSTPRAEASFEGLATRRYPQVTVGFIGVGTEKLRMSAVEGLGFHKFEDPSPREKVR